ncbi:4'-phosphopantetheinyl transferase family protein [Sphingomonas pokkalii]|nr:4'-phosphopantetheinyl transferase superfamily protein [Sphingomonas pokkalii]
MNNSGGSASESGTRVAWLALRDLADPVLDRFAAQLPATDADRAARFRRPIDRQAFLAGRLLLDALAAAAGCRSPLRIDDTGKPCFADGGPDFSITHAGGWVAVALGGAARVGIDLEPVDRTVDAMALARGVLAPDEHAALRNAMPSARAAQFLAAWTVKEAWAKALGLGLSADLTHARLDLAASRITVPDDSDWTIGLYCPEPGLYLSLALHHPDHSPPPPIGFARVSWAGHQLRFDHASISPEAANRSATSARSISSNSSSSAKIAADAAR